MPRVENCASTCANQICGSAGQKGGSFRVIAWIGAWPPSAPSTGGSGIVQFTSAGHQM